MPSILLLSPHSLWPAAGIAKPNIHTQRIEILETLPADQVLSELIETLPSDPFILPIQDGQITSGYGLREHPIQKTQKFHAGVDISGGQPKNRNPHAWVLAAATGIVHQAGWDQGHGYRVVLLHPDGWQTTYSHLSQVLTQPGRILRQGQSLGRMGQSGHTTGPHLHFEVRFQNKLVNPAYWMHKARPPSAVASTDAQP